METINCECYVSLEVAKLLKQAGFDWEVNARWLSLNGLRNKEAEHIRDILPMNDFELITGVTPENQNNGVANYLYSAPTLDVTQRWLREVKGYDIEIHVCHHYGISAKKGYFHELVINNEDYEDDDISSQFSRTYEEAQEAGIKKCLTLILEEDGIR